MLGYVVKLTGHKYLETSYHGFLSGDVCYKNLSVAYFKHSTTIAQVKTMHSCHHITMHMQLNPFLIVRQSDTYG